MRIFRFLSTACLLGLSAFAQTPIPAANTSAVTVGAGWVKSQIREVVRASSNKVYIFASDDSACLAGAGLGVLRAYAGTGANSTNPKVPTGFTEVDSSHHPVGHTSTQCQFSAGVAALVFSPDVRMDSTGLIHIAYILPQSTSAGNVIYQTFSTTDTGCGDANGCWGTTTQVATNGSACGGGSWPRWSNVALSLDASDHPYILWATSATCSATMTNAIQWSANLGSGFSVGATITGSSGTAELYPALTTALNGTMHAAWQDHSLSTQANIWYAKNTAGTWGTVENVTAGDSVVLAGGDDDQSPSITIDLNGLPHVQFLDGSVQTSYLPADNFFRERYRTAGGVWTDNSPPSDAGGAASAGTWTGGTSNGSGHTGQGYISKTGENFYFAGHNSKNSTPAITPAPFVTQAFVGANWTATTLIDPCSTVTSPSGEAGCDGSVSIRYDALRDNNPGIIDVLYFKENDGSVASNHHGTIFYKAIDIQSTLALPPGPYAGSAPPYANLWIDLNGGTCTRQATPGSYIDAQACSSIATAFSAASSGDIVVMLNGTYASQTVSGAAKTVTYYAQTYDSVLVGGLSVSAGGVTTHGIISSGTGFSRGSLSVSSPTSTVSFPIVIDGFRGKGGDINQAGFVTLSHSEIGNYDTSLCPSECDAVTMRGTTIQPNHLSFLNNVFHDVADSTGGSIDRARHNDMMSYGFNVGGDSILYDGNQFYNWGDGGSAIQSSGPLSNWTLQNNFFGGISPVTSHTCGNNFTYGQGTGSGTLVMRNNIYGSAACSAMVNTGGITLPSADFSGNIVRSGGTCNTGGTITSTTGGFNVAPTSLSSCAANNKICTPTYLNGAPTAANGWDVRLSSSDTCAKDSANGSSFPATDMFGTTRPQGSAPDAGAFEITGATSALSITTTSPLPAGTQAVAYSQNLLGSGGTAPYSWSCTANCTGTGPWTIGASGLTLSAAGVVSGTAATPATYTFTVQLADSASATTSGTFSVTINAASSLAITTTSLPAGAVGVAYIEALSATGGTPPYSWGISLGSLPHNLSLSSGGTISGTPDTIATSSFTVQVTDSVSATATQPLSINILSCATATPSFQGISFVQPGSPFTIQWDAIPGSTTIDGVVGLSQNAATTFTDNQVSTHFTTDLIQALNDGSGYTGAFAYSTLNQAYHFRAVVDTTAHTYTAFFTPPLGVEQQIGGTLGFRQSPYPPALGFLNFLEDSGSGSFQVCSVSIALVSNGSSVTGGVKFSNGAILR